MNRRSGTGSTGRWETVTWMSGACWKYWTGEGYDGWYVLEQDIMLAADPGYGPAAEVGRSLAYLNGVLEE